MSAAPRRLSAVLFHALLTTAVAAVVAVALAMTAIFYFSHEHQEEKRLVERAWATAAALEGLDACCAVDVLTLQVDPGVRETLVDADGRVLFDSAAEVVSASHADRPEIRAAEALGEGVVSRYSQTLGEDALYVAVRLDNGLVVRLSETRGSFVAFAGTVAAPIGVALLMAALAALGVSRLLTDRIAGPLRSIDVACPLKDAPYAETVPLLERIDAQRTQLEKQNHELARAEGLRRDFSANVSHEMKTPLQVILGYAELMGADMVSPEDVRRCAGVIYSEALAMQGLINDVLTLSRLDVPADCGAVRRPVDLHEVAIRCAERIGPVAQTANVQVEVRATPTVVAGDEGLLEEMVANLISNAVRYNRDGGRVFVEVGYGTGEMPGDLASVCAFVRVSDTGTGIPPEEQGKIFERFYRMERSRSKETGGTGLGLAIVKHVAQRHGGTVEVTSELGEGATFTVRLPLGPPEMLNQMQGHDTVSSFC